MITKELEEAVDAAWILLTNRMKSERLTPEEFAAIKSYYRQMYGGVYITDGEHNGKITVIDKIPDGGYEGHTAKPNSQCKPIRCIETGKVYYSISEAARQIGVSDTNLSACLSGKCKTIKGCHWEYYIDTNN